jgi:cytoskeletal protein CcmA (bactofilin family)
MIEITRYRTLRLALIFMLAISLGLGLTQPAFAQDVRYGDTVPEGDVVDNDIVLYGDEVTIDGQVKGDVLAVSSKVTVNGQIDGSLVALGEVINVGGKVGGTVYSSGVNLVLEPTAAIQNNLFFLGLNMAMDRGATIGRDLYTVTMGARLAGQVGRNTNAVIGLIEIVKSVLQGLNIEIGLQPTGLAKLRIQPGFMSAGLLPVIGTRMSAMEPALSQPQQADTTAQQAGQWGLDRLRELVGLLVVGLLMIWLFPARLSMWSERARARPLRSAGSGIITLITGFAVTAIAVVVIVGIAFGLNAITLQNLAFLFGVLGLLSVGLAFFVFWMFAAYISKVIVSYLVGRLILKRFAPRYKGRFWSLLLGVFLYILVTAIPYAGWIIGFIATLIGLGAVWLVYIDWRSPAEPASSASPEQLAAESATAETPEAGAESSEPAAPEE